MMQAGDLPKEAVQAMSANRLRSFLTLLGIIIGVATLVAVVSVISGLNGWVQDKVIQLSPD
ncbi:MAG TPA: ABC transporter permease, partial [Vicinamibacteria bacterium]